MPGKAVEVLRGLEWSGRTRGPGTSMGADDGEWNPSCPVCRGLKPGAGFGGFIASAYGHRRDCKLVEALREEG